MAVMAGLFLIAFVFALKQSSRSMQAPPDLSSVGRAASSSRAPSSKPVKLVILDHTNAEASRLMASVQEALQPYYPSPLTVNYVDVSKHTSATETLRLQNLPAIIFVDAAGREVHRREQWMSPEEINNQCKELGLLPGLPPAPTPKSSPEKAPLPN